MTGGVAPPRDALADEILQVVGTPGRVAVVEGEAGAGRSHLLDEVAGRLDAHDTLVVVLRGGTDHPWRDVVRVGPGATSGQGMLLAELEADAQGREVVVLFDDVDHTDEATASLVAGLIGAGHAAGCLATRVGAPLPVSITGMLRAVPTRWLTLAPLDDHETTAWAERTLDGPLSPALAREVHRRTQGLPQLLEVALAHWRHLGLVECRRGVLVSTAELIPVVPHAQQLDDLDLDERRVVQLLAVAGPQRVDLVGQAMPEAALVTLERRGLIELVGAGDGERVRLRSAVTQAAALDAIDPDERLELLAELVDRLDATPGPSEAVVGRDQVDLTCWKLELGRPVDADAAHAAAVEAAGLGATDRAHRLATAAWAAAPTVARGMLLAGTLQQLGEDDQALAVLEQAWALGDDPDRGVLAARLIAAHLYCHEDHDATLALLDRLLGDIADPSGRERARGATAYVLTMAGWPTMAGAVLTGADPAAASTGALTLVGDPGAVTATTTPAAASATPTAAPALSSGDLAPDPLVAFVDLAARTLEGRGLTGWRAPGPGEAATVGFGSLAAEDACALFRIVRLLHLAPPATVSARAVALADEAGARGAVLAEGWAAWLGAYAELYRGGLGPARALAHRSWRVFAPLGLDSRLRAALSLLDLVEALDPEGADVQIAWRAEVPSGTMWLFHAEQVRFDALRGALDDPAGAATRLREATGPFTDRGLRVAALVARLESLLLGDPPAGPDELEALTATAAAIDATLPAPGEPSVDPGALQRLAATATAVSTQRLPAVVTAVDALMGGDQLLHAWLAVRQALGTTSGGHRERAELVAFARDLAGRTDLPHVPGTSPADATGSLTPREREVVALVATGMTNREVGEQLGIARRTVDNALQAAYRKLGTNDRADLAALLGDPPGPGGG